VVFGDVIGAEAGRLVALDQGEPRPVEFAERPAAMVEMVEDAVLHGGFSRGWARRTTRGTPSPYCATIKIVVPALVAGTHCPHRAAIVDDMGKREPRSPIGPE